VNSLVSSPRSSSAVHTGQDHIQVGDIEQVAKAVQNAAV